MRGSDFSAGFSRSAFGGIALGIGCLWVAGVAIGFTVAGLIIAALVKYITGADLF